jgi:DMSO/TMAO reductase YedYZ molybdopterin-dependent catalytic subunit
MAIADDLQAARAGLQMINPAPYNAEAPPEALAEEITPTELHYVRSNFAVPSHDGTLEVGGAVENPTTLTLDDLRAMPRYERAVTLECAGNGRLDTRPLPIGEPWGDYAVSTARWTGALLRDVLQQAHPASDGVDVQFQGADHGAYHLKPVLAETNKDDLTFVRALPLAHAADPEAEILIAYEMNGAPLGRDHGAPFRLIVPHWYAVASVKWLKRIDVLTAHGSTLSRGTQTVRGKAWSGTGPVTRVDVSFTGEGDWHAAQLQPAKGPYQWQEWSFDWEANDIGRHTLRARATDGAGNVQPDVPPWNRLGYGNNAIEVSYVDVR